MVLNTAGYISFSQMNSTVRFTNGNLGVNTTAPASNVDVNGTFNVSGGSSLANATATNISASNLIVTTSVSSGLLSGTNLIGTNVTVGTLSATTISGSNLSISENVTVGGTLTIVSFTSSNLVDTNISVGTLNVSGLSNLTNVTTTNISTGTLNASTGITASNLTVTGGGTLTNLINSSISTGTLIASTGITGVNLRSDTSLLQNVNVNGGSGITTGTINATGLSSFGNTTATNVSAGVLIASTGITTGTINATGTAVLANAITTNISTGGLNASGTSTLVNAILTNIFTGGLNASGTTTLANTTATNISAGVLIASTGITSGNINTTNIATTTSTIGNLTNTNMTLGNISISGSNNALFLESAGTNSSFINIQNPIVRGIIGVDGAGYSSLSNNLSISTWTNHSIDFFTNQTHRMTITTSGNVGIGTRTPAYILDVNGTIARNGIRFPVFRNGTFSGSSKATIPVGFSTTAYNYIEIKVRFLVSNIGGTNVTLGANSAFDGLGTGLSYSSAELTYRQAAYSSPLATTSGLVATNCEGNGIDALFTMKITRNIGGGPNLFVFDTVYCYSNFGASRVIGNGHINTTFGTNSLGSIFLQCATGTISGTYSIQVSY